MQENNQMKEFIVNTEDRKTSISELYSNILEGDIILNPDFQRNYVYDVRRASRIIESILLEIPLPAIFANEEKDGTMEVIDGVQRLTSVVKFIKNEYKLEGLIILSELNGKCFKDLGKDIQRTFKQKSLRVIKFKKGCSEEVKYEIFMRLNQGAIKLSNQELRNCMYRGYFNNKLKEIASSRLFNEIVHITDSKANRMAKEEIALRGISALNYEKAIKKPALNPVMNNLMNIYRNNNEIVDVMVRELYETYNKVRSILGYYPFQLDFAEDGKFSNANHDAILILFSKYDKNSMIYNKDNIKQAILDIVKSEEYSDLTKYASSNISKILARTTLLEEAISPYIIELDKKRFFSKEIKEQLFNDNPYCAICNQKIEKLEDANVDHIIAWSKGGKTTLDNAQLTHEFCNKSKGNNLNE